MSDDAGTFRERLANKTYGGPSTHALLSAVIDKAALLHEEHVSSLRDQVDYWMGKEQATAAAGSKWQPIETAPRDGTRVVLATPDASRFPDGWRFHVDYWRKYRDDHGEGWGRIVDWPTHWMPLPAPPEPTKETR